MSSIEKLFGKEYIVKVLNDGECITAGEIIRCRECVHRDKETMLCRGRGWPMQLVPDDGYCSIARRKEE